MLQPASFFTIARHNCTAWSHRVVLARQDDTPLTDGHGSITAGVNWLNGCCPIAGDAAMQQLAAVLVTHSTALGSCAPSLLAAAALELHAAAGPVLEGCFSHADGNADLVQAVLEGLHAAMEHCGVHTDGVLRGSIALRLAALLEEQQQLEQGIEVVGQVRHMRQPAGTQAGFE